MQKFTKASTSKNRTHRNTDDNASQRLSVEHIGYRTNTGQVSFGRNAASRLGASYNPGSTGMQGILGVKKASLFGKSPANAARTGGDMSDMGMTRHGQLD